MTPFEIIIVGSTHWFRIEHCRGLMDSEESIVDASVRVSDMQDVADGDGAGNSAEKCFFIVPI